jgi:hypothetical protein
MHGKGKYVQNGYVYQGDFEKGKFKKGSGTITGPSLSAPPPPTENPKS